MSDPKMIGTSAYTDICETSNERNPCLSPYRLTAHSYKAWRSGNIVVAEFRHQECGTWWWNEFPAPRAPRR